MFNPGSVVRPTWVSRVGLLIVLCLCLQSLSITAQPLGFSDQLYLGGWDQVTGFTWDDNGRMYVWEKGGKVWIVENGARQTQPLIDISEEVGNWADFGLVGFALDPSFRSNGYIYLFYVVDRHHLQHYGTADYDPAANDFQSATIGRITRYQAVAPGFTTVDYGSRTILFGETASTGGPITHGSHGVGSLVFGEDGTLLASMGDGASFVTVDEGSAPETYWQQALDDGIITSAENVGSYRSQMLDSHSGKILRFDPATGNGVSSNPFFDPGHPRSARSRTWALGLRNPYRFSLIPDTGDHHATAGNPGVLIFGDVGWTTREELSFVTGPGQNFGWPRFEGMTHQPGYNIAVYAPSAHVLPKVDWRKNAGRVYVNGQILTVGSSSFPGPAFTGNASTGGFWYTGSDFPAEYHDTYFHADYGGGWIMNFVFDTNYNPVEIRGFLSNGGPIVFLDTHPTQGGVYYVKYQTEIRRIVYTGNNNRLPVAVAEAGVNYGPSPLSVQFAGENSYDPDQTQLTYHWNFGDGATSTQANPIHVFDAANGEQFDVILTVTDAEGATGQTSLTISLNNTPPVIHSTSIDLIDTYAIDQPTILPLNAVVSDDESSDSELSYAWQLFMHHNEHNHPESVDHNPSTSTVLTPAGCTGATYWYRIALTVTDPGGLSAHFEKEIFLDCPGVDQFIDFAPIPNRSVSDGPVTLNATASSGLAIIYYLASGPASLAGDVLTPTAPGTITVVATQPGNETYAPAHPVTRSFWVEPGVIIGAPTLSFTPVDDAYLQGTTRFNDAQLKVQPGYRVSYLKFNVSGLPGPVQSATLRLQENGDIGSGTLRVHRGSHNNWTETTLTTANAPTANGQVGQFTGAVAASAILNIDVTPLVTGDGSYSVLLQQEAGGNDIWFGSEESTRKPQLIVRTSGVSTPSYALTVNGGSGSGNYAAGSTVNLVASAPSAGQEFDRWTGDTANVANVNAASTSITMPAAPVSVTATYRPVSTGGTFNFTPVDDAYLQGSTRFNDAQLKVQPGYRVSYLKFTVSGLSGTVQSATLRLQENGDAGSGTLRVHRGSHNNWTETTLTTANAPTANGQVGSFTGAVAAAQTLNIDVTSLVTGNGTYSVVLLQDAGGNDIWFGSEESTRKPQLIVTTSGDGGATGLALSAHPDATAASDDPATFGRWESPSFGMHHETDESATWRATIPVDASPPRIRVTPLNPIELELSWDVVTEADYEIQIRHAWSAEEWFTTHHITVPPGTFRIPVVARSQTVFLRVVRIDRE